MEWKPIETAPKGTEDTASPIVLLLSMTHLDDYPTSISIGFWCDIDSVQRDRKGWCDWCRGLDEDDVWAEVVSPTHWMPLPEAPSA